jgi:O-methyltransferase domain
MQSRYGSFPVVDRDGKQGADGGTEKPARVLAGLVTEPGRICFTRGADCYVLANVLHDWDDARSIQILRNCRRSMAGRGRVLIVERLIPEDGRDPVPTLLSDINMLILTGGKERSNAECSELLHAAGLKPGTIQPVAFPYGVIEGFAD